tara:strand:+ start:1610 stop:2197 length:588 start_codon:yes stop_codon:yes gene_type:complete
MATSYIDKLQSQAFKAGVEKNTESSLKWFQKQMSQMKSVNRKALLMDDNFKARSRPLTGRMFMYFYDPKTKKEMPYYDRFPLIFMVEKAKGGFYGLNLHYLPPKLRAKFFDRLTEYSTNKRYDITTRLRLSYNLLKGASKLSMFGPCFKHYLTKQVRSKMVEVPASEWESVLFMPTENFKKSNKTKVWSDTRKMI